MPIKQSDLERKWYYRALKVVLILLPLLLLLLLLLKRGGIACSIAPFDIPDATTVVLIAIAFILYYPLLRLLRWVVLYLVYGGIEDDATRRSTQPVPTRSKNKVMEVAPLVFLFVIFIIVALSQGGYITLPKLFDGDSGTVLTPKPGPSCPATSAQTGTPCRTASGGVGVSGVIVPGRCACPSDTTYASMDNITAGGPYKMCTCK